MIRRVGRLLVALTAAAAGIVPSWADVGEDDPAIGIWSTNMAFTPGLHGELKVTKSAEIWRASIGGAEATSGAKGLRFIFPDNGGEFRGALGEGGDIEGFWIQPVTDRSDPRDPGSAGLPYASPLILEPSARGEWHGTVTPLDDRFTLHLKIDRNTDGLLVGAFRNPEFNSNGGASWFNVSREGDDVRFNQEPHPGAAEITLNAMLLHSPDRLRLMWPDLGRIVELVRHTPQEAAASSPVRPASRPTSIAGRPSPTTVGRRRAPPPSASTRGL